MKRPKVDPTKRQIILKLTIGTLRRMLTFATTVNIQTYIIDRHARDFRDFEAELAELEYNSRIKGTGVLAKRDEITQHDQDFFYNEVPLGSHELGAYIDKFPFSAAAASYLFTLLEVHGNEVAALVNPDNIRKNKAWHEDVRGNADSRDSVQVETAREAFAKHFGADASDVPELAARRIVELKRARNEFAHDDVPGVDFERFLHNTLAVVCHIAFLITDADRISVYPWEDHMDTFTPQSKP